MTDSTLDWFKADADEAEILAGLEDRDEVQHEVSPSSKSIVTDHSLSSSPSVDATIPVHKFIIEVRVYPGGFVPPPKIYPIGITREKFHKRKKKPKKLMAEPDVKEGMIT